MKRIKTGITVLVSGAFIAAAGMTAGCGNSQPGRVSTSGEELRGRDFVRLGTLITVTGTLKPERGEWFLISGDKVYEIHLGDHEHRAKTGIKLAEGRAASVKGFMYKQEGVDEIDIAVCTVIVDGKEYRFRENDGTPLWRGQSSGEGAGEAERSGYNRGAGRRQ